MRCNVVTHMGLGQAVLAAVDAEAMMSSLGPKSAWSLCPAVFMCGTPWESREAEEFYNQNDTARSKELLAEAGYNGKAITLLKSYGLRDHHSSRHRPEGFTGGRGHEHRHARKRLGYDHIEVQRLRCLAYVDQLGDYIQPWKPRV